MQLVEWVREIPSLGPVDQIYLYEQMGDLLTTCNYPEPAKHYYAKAVS